MTNCTRNETFWTASTPPIIHRTTSSTMQYINSEFQSLKTISSVNLKRKGYITTKFVALKPKIYPILSSQNKYNSLKITDSKLFKESFLFSKIKLSKLEKQKIFWKKLFEKIDRKKLKKSFVKSIIKKKFF